MIGFSLALVIIFGAITLLGFELWRRNRRVWNELFETRRYLQEIRTTQTAAIKRITMLEIGQGFRLPARIPSQHGEDILLWNFFDRKLTGFYVEVGAYDGVGFSNSYFFEAIGWTGVLIEPVPAHAESCERARPFSRVISAAAGKETGGKADTLNIVNGPQGVGTLSYLGHNSEQAERIAREGGSAQIVDVAVVSLDQILADHTGEIDFVSIDVEGRELDVLAGFDIARFRPRVLVIEDNSGGKDQRVSAWLSERGYDDRYRCEHNVFFVRRGELAEFHW